MAVPRCSDECKPQRANEKIADAIFALAYDLSSYPLPSIRLSRGLSNPALLGGARCSRKIQFAARNP
jgi:hypothetical protein